MDSTGNSKHTHSTLVVMMMTMIPKYIKTLRFVVLNYSVLVLLYSTAHYFSTFHWRSPFHSITAYQWRSRIVESPHLQVSFIHKTKRKEYYDSFWLAPLNCIQSKCILFFANKTWMAREWMHLVKGTEMNNIFIRWSTDLTWNHAQGQIGILEDKSRR